MNKFELDKVMECFGFEKSDNYKINGCNYYHDGRYFTIVNDKIPYELALLIRKKYDNDIYKIRVNGNHESEFPGNDVYKYHIDTIEGLVAFILESQEYYKSQKLYLDLDQTLNLIYSKILHEVQPNISVYDWMLERENRKDYFKTIFSSKTYLDVKLRKKIESFDNVVNPFANNNLDVDYSIFITRGYGYCHDNWFSLVDKESGIILSTIRKLDGFVIKLHIPTEKPFEINVYHYFDKNGEVIAFEKHNESDLTRVEYNLTDSTFGEHYGEKHIANLADKKYIIQNLDKYIALIDDVIKRNIVITANRSKTLKRNK